MRCGGRQNKVLLTWIFDKLITLFSEIFLSRTSHITQLFPVIINACYWLCFDTPFKNRPIKCVLIHINRTIVCTPYPPTFYRLGARDYIGTMPESCMSLFSNFPYAEHHHSCQRIHCKVLRVLSASCCHLLIYILHSTVSRVINNNVDVSL